MSAPTPNSSQQGLIEALARGELVGDAKRQAEYLLEHSGACREQFHQLTRTRFPSIPNYTVIEQVGKGGFGVVYKAVHHATERIVALKVLFSKTPVVATYFENEVHLIARLRHPNIATLYDAQLSQPPLHYTMDFVEGERLNDFIKKQRLSLAERIEIVRKVVLAVGYAHSQGVVHRDVKPQNILVDARHEPHIVDFGIAKKLRLDQIPDAYRAPSGIFDMRLASPGSDETTRVMEGGPVGTLGYIAPEVANGTGIDARSDIFALGALLFHCVTLEPARLARDAEQRDEMLLARRVTHPEDLSAIIARCVASSPGDRYPSCDELAADLDRYRRGRPIRARAEASYARRASRLASLIMREYPVAVQLTIVGCVAALTTSVFWGLGARTAQPPLGPGQTMIISFTDATVDRIDKGDFEQLAPGVQPNYVPSHRALHGRLMEKLALADPLVVAFDYYFDKPAPQAAFDEAFAAGARTLMMRSRPNHGAIPVVVGAAEFDANSEPLIAPLIRDAVHSWGTLASPNMEMVRPGEMEIACAFSRGFEDPVPGLSLAAFAAYRHVNCVPSIRIDKDRLEVQVLYRQRAPTPGVRRMLTDVDRVPLHVVREAPAEPAKRRSSRITRFGEPEPFQPGDQVANVRVLAEPLTAWAERTIPYEAVLAADERQIQLWFDRKAVLIGQMRPGIDVHTIWGNTEIFGCLVHAQALDSLLSTASIERRLSWRETAPFALLWSAAAGLLASVSRPRRWAGLQRMAIGGSAAVLVGLAMGVYGAISWTDVWLLQLAIALSALLVSGGLSYWAKAYRERQMQLAPVSVTYDVELEQLPSTLLAGQHK